MRTHILLLSLLVILATACSGTDDTTLDEDTVNDAATQAESAIDDTVSSIDAGDCTEAAEALSSVPTALAGALTGNLDTEAVAAQAQAFTDLADQVPADIQGDFDVLADAFDQAATTLGGITLEAGSVPDADAQAALTELSDTFSDSEVTAATSNVSDYFANGCQ